ncbi:MAG: hypothetical protein H6R04_175 [Burkholderiaceae bacterium]|nr:hypothetical protein [Burkholderiaceae bacterium]
MPIFYLRRLTGKDRNVKSNLHLGMWLAFIAGAMNAGAYLAVRQYTSHMTGIVSSMADGLALGDLRIALAGLGALVSFMIGAALSEMLIMWGRNRNMQSEYALCLTLEAILLLAFGVLGEYFHDIMGLFVSCTVMLLCFTMGLQNAIITRISNALIRTTHMTGIVTDIGIELGRMCYWNRKVDKEDKAYVRANRDRLDLFAILLAMFFIGGVTGAQGFKHMGFWATVPLALILMILAIVPVVDDVTTHLKH